MNRIDDVGWLLGAGRLELSRVSPIDTTATENVPEGRA